MSVYVINLNCREKDPDTANVFYSELENKKIKFRDDIVMASNEEVGTATLESNIYKTDCMMQK